MKYSKDIKKSLTIKILFIVSLVVILGLFWSILIRGEKQLILMENRYADKIPSFSFKSFLNSEYQNSIESAIGDQLLFGETIKSKIKQFNNITFSMATKFRNKNGYYLVTDGYYAYNGYDYLLYPHSKLDIIKENKETFLRYADSFNKSANSIHKYMYMTTDERTMDFENPSVVDEFNKQIAEAYNTFKYDYLKIRTFEEFMPTRYKTDHHWNYRGSCQGYVDIINMMFGKDEEVLVPRKVEFSCNFYGSKATVSQFFDYKEKFKVYDFTIPAYKSYVDGMEKEYGHRSEYLALAPKCYDAGENHYASYYGMDYKEVIFDFNNPDKENLLIIGASDTNAIALLIATHFNKTYKIDLRHYKDFDIENYIKENKISKLLYVGNINTIIKSEFELGVK